jgi:hypothetical protein
MSLKGFNEPGSSLPRDNPCYSTESMNLIALGASADDGRNYLFNYAHFLYAEHSKNPAARENSERSSERLRIRFTVGEIIILGDGIQRLAKEVQVAHLRSVAAVSRNYPVAFPVVVHSVTVKLDDAENHK